MPRRGNPKYAALTVIRALEEASEMGECRTDFSLYTGDWTTVSRNTFRYKHSGLSNRDIDASDISALSNEHYRLEYIIRLCKALKKSASALLEIQESALRPIVLALSKGIAVLPDELLGLIINFASQDEHEGTRHAQWLSQVSRRFRRIALGDYSLWATQYQCFDHMGLPDIDRCVSRAGLDTDLQIVVNVDDFFVTSEVREFVQNCSVYAHRWKSLTLVGDWETGKNHAVTIGEALDGLVKRIDLDLPRLHELCLIERRRDKYGGLTWWHASNTEFAGQGEILWTTPKLQILRCTQYIPPPTLPFESLTEFALSLTLVPGNAIEQMDRLVAFLRGGHQFVAIDIELVGPRHRDPTTGEVLAITPIPLSTLKTFRLSLTCLDSPLGLSCIPEPFLRSLVMSNLEEYTLSTGLYELPPTLLLDPVLHPRISRFSIEAPRRKMAPRWRMWNEKPKVVDIPLDRIPNVASLTVTTTLNKVSFSRDAVDVVGGPNSDHSSLRVLCFRSCAKMDSGGLRETIASLRSVKGVWEGIERVVVRDCDALEYEACVEVTGKEKLYFSQS